MGISRMISVLIFFVSKMGDEKVGNVKAGELKSVHGRHEEKDKQT
jgi:hypothetical protein